MAIGQIDQPYGSLTLVRGWGSAEERVSQGTYLNNNHRLNVRSNAGANVRFLDSSYRYMGYAASIWPYRGSGTYTFPCSITGGCGLYFWANGSRSGCGYLRVGVTYTATSRFASRTPAAALNRAAENVAIEELVDRKIMAGYPDATTLDEKYRPNDPVTRAQFASLLSKANHYWKILEINRQLSFVDLPASHWASEAVALAVRTSFLSGYDDGLFRPDQNVSRLEILVALVGGLGLPRPSDANNIDSILGRYQDANQIADWAKSAIAAATQAGLIIDSTQTQFNPQKPATRGETAVLIAQALKYRDLEVYEGPEVLVSPQTQEPTLVQVSSSTDDSNQIEIISLTSTVKIIARPTPDGPAQETTLTVGQRFFYRRQDDGTYTGSVNTIDPARRLELVKSEEMRRFLNDWSQDAQPTPKADCQKLFEERLLQLQPQLNKRIYNGMDFMGPFITTPFQGGNNSCVWAVNQVFASTPAKIAPFSTNKVSDTEENDLLKQLRGRRIEKPSDIQVGDIVIASGQQHIGICLIASPDPTKTVVRSSSATADKFTYNSFLDQDFQFGGVSRIYRLQY